MLLHFPLSVSFADRQRDAGSMMLHPLPLIYFVLSVVLRPWETLLSLPRLAPWGAVPTPGGGEGGGSLIVIPEDDTFRICLPP